MPSIGYIQLRAYTSNAQLPLRDVAVTITEPDGAAVAMRLTDRNGMIRQVEIPTPDRLDSQHPGSGEKPYHTVNVYAYKKGYEIIESEDLQVFPDTTTFLDLEMIPLSEYPDIWEDIAVYPTPPQNL